MLYIGKIMLDRMNLLGLSVDELADKAFIEKDNVDAIIQNKIALEEIDEFDMSLLCGVLHCKRDFFVDTDAREKDLVASSMNRGLDNEKSIKVKAKIQDFMNDYVFVTEILSEEKEVYS